MIEAFTVELAVIIVAATVLAFTARLTGQPTIIAYIISGLILGGLNIVSESALTALLSELGLAFLLFLVGLEMKVEKIEDSLRPSLAAAVVQLPLVAAFACVSSLFLGFSLDQSVFIGAAFSFSSTALAVKLLSDKGQISERFGSIDVSILLIQDVVVVVLFALASTGSSSVAGAATSFVRVLFIVGVLSLVSVIGSRSLVSRFLRRLSGDPHMLFILGVAWAFAFISAAELLNVSIEIGAFVAGLGLAQLPYSFEVRERVRPLSDLFIAIFFINFGLGLETSSLASVFLEAAAMTALIIPVKLVAIGAPLTRFMDARNSFLSGLNLTQTSEFALVLLSVASGWSLVTPQLEAFVSLTVLLSMAVSSYLIRYNEKIYDVSKPLLSFTGLDTSRERRESPFTNHLVFLGFDEMARNVLDEASGFFDDTVIVDRDPENIDELQRKPHRFVYGDIRHGKIADEAYLDEALLVVSFISDPEVNKSLLERTESPTIVKARNFEEAAELYDQGADYVIIKNMISGDRLGDQVKAFLEDREQFREQIQQEQEKIRWRTR